MILALLPVDGLAASTRPDVIPGQWIVVFEDGVKPGAAAADLAREHGLGLTHVYEHALNGFAATVPDARVAALQADPRIINVVPDRVVLALDGPTGVDRIDAEGVSAMGSCDSPAFRIAILDSGIDFNHPDLNVDVSNSETFAPGGPDADDKYGHGTHVAGTVAAKIGGATVNGVDVRGVAPGACLMAVKVLDNIGEGSDSSIIAGLDYVAANAGVLSISVANMSLGRSAGDDNVMHMAIQNTAKAGVVIIVAAGNASVDAANVVPAAYDEVITVSAIKDTDGAGGAFGGNGDDTFASFSNFGVDVDIAAPGVDILSTFIGGAYAIGSGTSFSAPLVTGAVAERIAASALTVSASTDPMAARNAAMAALGTKAQTDPACGFAGDPDSHEEPLVYVGQPNDTCGAANQAPTVSAGANQTITLPDLANLSGTANDDGLPDPPNTVTTTWSKVAGPGTVTFGNTAALNTTASFSASGVYVLRLTASDSVLQNIDDVAITVDSGGVNRIWGANRYATAAEVAAEVFPAPSIAYIVVGTNFPDALVAGSRGDGPVLLTTTDALPADTVASLNDIAPLDEIFIVGGTGVVSSSVETTLKTYANTVTRISGSSRYETAAEFSKAMFLTADTVFVAFGGNYPDALLASAAAGQLDAPVLLVTTGSIPSATAAELTRLSPSSIFIVGGTGVVSASVETSLGEYGTTIRLAGSNRFATAAVVSSTLFPFAGHAWVATGMDFPDALVAAAGAINSDGPILLVQKDSIPADTDTELARIGRGAVTIVGGIAVVSSAVQSQLADYLS